MTSLTQKKSWCCSVEDYWTIFALSPSEWQGKPYTWPNPNSHAGASRSCMSRGGWMGLGFHRRAPFKGSQTFWGEDRTWSSRRRDGWSFAPEPQPWKGFCHGGLPSQCPVNPVSSGSTFLVQRWPLYPGPWSADMWWPQGYGYLLASLFHALAGSLIRGVGPPRSLRHQNVDAPPAPWACGLVLGSTVLFILYFNWGLVSVVPNLQF